MKTDADQRRSLLIRLAGLLYIGLLATIIAACGLALAFGSYRLSMFLFFIAIAMLALIKLVIMTIK